MEKEKTLGAFDEVKKIENDQLRNLLKEIKEIGKLDAPRNAKKSKTMQRLFNVEKSKFNYWADQFSNVQRAIENEILWRVRTDVW